MPENRDRLMNMTLYNYAVTAPKDCDSPTLGQLRKYRGEQLARATITTLIARFVAFFDVRLKLLEKPMQQLITDLFRNFYYLKLSELLAVLDQLKAERNFSRLDANVILGAVTGYVEKRHGDTSTEAGSDAAHYKSEQTFDVRTVSTYAATTKALGTEYREKHMQNHKAEVTKQHNENTEK